MLCFKCPLATTVDDIAVRHQLSLCTVSWKGRLCIIILLRSFMKVTIYWMLALCQIHVFCHFLLTVPLRGGQQPPHFADEGHESSCLESLSSLPKVRSSARVGRTRSCPSACGHTGPSCGQSPVPSSPRATPVPGLLTKCLLQLFSRWLSVGSLFYKGSFLFLFSIVSFPGHLFCA